MNVAEDSLPHTSGGNKRLSFLTELPIEDSDEESHQQSKHMSSSRSAVALRIVVIWNVNLLRQYYCNSF